MPAATATKSKSRVTDLSEHMDPYWCNGELIGFAWSNEFGFHGRVLRRRTHCARITKEDTICYGRLCGNPAGHPGHEKEQEKA